MRLQISATDLPNYFGKDIILVDPDSKQERIVSMRGMEDGMFVGVIPNRGIIVRIYPDYRDKIYVENE